MKWLGVFVALFALDFVWAKYTHALTAKRPVASGALASVLIVLSGAAAVGYTSDPWLLIPAALGAFAGTWCAVRKS